MHAVVVDDHDMGVTHVIRGDDHLNNAFRQLQIIHAMGWPEPVYAHVPLIHGADGAKLSKRHGALAVAAYRDMGYLPEAVRNYLLRLGWSHGDDEIISTEDAVRWFELEGIGRSPARLDLAKLDSVNAHYVRATDDAGLAGLLAPFLERRLGRVPDAAALERVRRGMPGLKQRAKTLVELADNATIYAEARPLALEPKARALLDAESRARLAHAADALSASEAWTQA